VVEALDALEPARPLEQLALRRRCRQYTNSTTPHRRRPHRVRSLSAAMKSSIMPASKIAKISPSRAGR